MRAPAEGSADVSELFADFVERMEGMRTNHVSHLPGNTATASAQIIPFPIRLTPEHSYYVWRYQQCQREYGLDDWDCFKRRHEGGEDADYFRRVFAEIERRYGAKTP